MKFLLMLAVVCCLWSTPAAAQVGPTASELSAYSGLHAAAATGDIIAIERLVASGTNREAEDKRQRTPLHVAVYQKQHEAARRLLQLGANPKALEIDRYD